VLFVSFPAATLSRQLSAIATPPSQAFQELQQEAPELLLLGTIRAAVAPNDLAAVAAAEPAIVQQWEAAGLLAPAQILAAVQGLGYELERKVEVAAAGGKQQQQQPQEGQDGVLSAVVDVCLRLPDQRRVAVLVSVYEGCWDRGSRRKQQGSGWTCVLRGAEAVCRPLPAVSST
jgi:hypothetical protein